MIELLFPVPIRRKTAEQEKDPLYLAASEKKAYVAEFVLDIEDLQERNAIDSIDECGKAPIHRVVKNGDLDDLKKLVESNADPNLQTKQGDTPLMCILKLCGTAKEKPSHLECFRYLLELNSIDLNIPDADGFMPMRYAITYRKREKMALYINELCQYGSMVNWEWLSEEKDDCIRRHAGYLKMEKMKCDSCKCLFYWIQNGLEDEFCENFKHTADALPVGIPNPRIMVECTDTNKTFLQYACGLGLVKAVKLLLDYQAPINCSEGSILGDKPLYLTLYYARSEVLRLLLRHPQLEKTPPDSTTLLHYLLQYPAFPERRAECLKVLLNEECFDVNARDCSQKTPLHYAVMNNLTECVAELLEKEANVHAVDKSGMTPFKLMNYSMMKKYLDSKISSNNKPRDHPAYFVRLDYRDFFRGNFSEETWTKFFNMIINSSDLKMNSLISHPMCTAIIFMKWYRIKWFYYAYLLLYAFFCCTLTGYCFSRPAEIDDENRITNAILIFIVLLLLILELMVLSIRVRGYVGRFENVHRVLVLIFTITCINFMYFDVNNPGTLFFQAFTFLLAWFQLFLTLGKQPDISFYADMFRVASQTHVKFLSIHSIIFIGFALSFHCLLKDENNGPFNSPAGSLFKTIIMSTGEFSSEDLNFDSFAGASHVIFVGFVITVAIVLINLLIGLAGSSTRRIEDNKYLYRCIAEVRVISSYEKVLYFYRPLRKIFDVFLCFNYPSFSTLHVTGIHVNQNVHGFTFFFGSIGLGFGDGPRQPPFDKQIIRIVLEIVDANCLNSRCKEKSVVEFEKKVIALQNEIEMLKKRNEALTEEILTLTSSPGRML